MKNHILGIIFMLVSISFFSQKRDHVLLEIDGKPIKVSEFKSVFEKNLDIIDNKESKDVLKNLELFINYKLKVKEAYAIKIDTLTSYKNEIRKYTEQLSAPFLQDSAFVEAQLKEAYYRTKNELKVKHILLKVTNNASPEDTLLAYQKISDLRKRIIEGEDFNKLAEQFSEDPSARAMKGRKGNQGELGYFAAFKMVYAFEDASYKTSVGELSPVFRSRYGYHIVKVDAIRPSKGEVEVAHILVTDTTNASKKTIDEVYSKLQQNEKFEDLALAYSKDRGFL